MSTDFRDLAASQNARIILHNTYKRKVSILKQKSKIANTSKHTL